MSDDSWYLKAQKQYDEWAREMVGVAATGESIRIMLQLFVGPPPKANMWAKLFKFFVDNEMHHHELRNHPHPGEEHQWKGNDDEHPAVVLDVQWHYINDPDLRPFLLR